MNGQVFLVKSFTKDKKVEDLNIGELGIYAMDTVEQKTVNASPATKADFFNIALGKASGGVWTSREFHSPKHRNFEFKKWQYREPVKEVIVVTTDCLGGSMYDEVTVKIRTNSDYSGSGIESLIQSFSVVGKHKSQLKLWEAVAEQITTDLIESAVATDAGLVITSKLGSNITVTFDFTKDINNTCTPCDCCSAKIEQTNEGDLGSGTYAQIMARVHEWQIWTGRGHGLLNATLGGDPLTDFVIPTDIKATTYYLKWSNVDQPDDSHTAAAFNVYQEVMVVVPEGVDTTYFEQTMQALVVNCNENKSYPQQVNFN